jgi:hypothetical protein
MKLKVIISTFLIISVIVCCADNGNSGEGGQRELNFLKKLFQKKEQKKEFIEEEFEKHYFAKEKGLEEILGKMQDVVGHALIPFDIGGAVDMYYFPDIIKGTGFATMELIQPDGTGPIPNNFGTYELVAFTKLAFTNDRDGENPFNKIERRVCGIFTTVGHYSFEVKLQPGETLEIPAEKQEDRRYIIFDNFTSDNKSFKIDDQQHGLLLIIDLYKSEMEFAMENGSTALFKLLREKGIYPYSDLDREPVI